MIPAVSAPLPMSKGPQTTQAPPSAPGQTVQTGSASRQSGETGGANLRPETPRAIDAAKQSAVAPRLRDQETSERTDRRSLSDTGPTGPAPAFAETFLQRAARLAFAPPEAPAAPEESADVDAPEPRTQSVEDEPEAPAAPAIKTNLARIDAAEAFATARTATEGAPGGDVDVRE